MTAIETMSIEMNEATAEMKMKASRVSEFDAGEGLEMAKLRNVICYGAEFGKVSLTRPLRQQF